MHDTVEVAGAQYDTVTTLGSTTNLMMPSSSMSAVSVIPSIHHGNTVVVVTAFSTWHTSTISTSALVLVVPVLVLLARGF